jgi:hypothetical protein
VTVRLVQGGAVWRDQNLGKAVRFYKSTSVPSEECIRYASNSNKVPNSDGCRPLLDLPETFPADVDRQYYIGKARELVREIGYA